MLGKVEIVIRIEIEEKIEGLRIVGIEKKDEMMKEILKGEKINGIWDLVGKLKKKSIKIERKRIGKVCKKKIKMRKEKNVEWWVKVRGRKGNDFNNKYVRWGDEGFEWKW